METKETDPDITQTIQKNKFKTKATNDIIQQTQLLQINVSQAIKHIMSLLQDLLLEYTNNRFQEYMQCMSDVKYVWATTENNLLQLETPSTNASFVAHAQSQNILNTILDDERLAIKEIEAGSKEEAQTRNIVQFLLDNDKTKPFLQQLYGLIAAMQINLELTPSILLLCSEIATPYEFGSNCTEEAPAQLPQYQEYVLCILSHGMQYADAIEHDLRARIENIQIQKTPQDYEHVVDGIIPIDKLDWTRYVESIPGTTQNNQHAFVAMFENLFDVTIKEVVEGMVTDVMTKENDTVLCWALKIDTKESYKYNMDYIIGPCLIGLMACTYFPNSLNAKYLRCHQMITNAYIREIYVEMDTKQIVPQSIINLIELFFKTTLDEYPFGCMVLCSLN
eukprot:214187_1